MHQDQRRQKTQIWRSTLTGPELSTLRTHRISIGEIWASAQPSLVKTLLGSCVAVCLYDPVARMGGMNHILLPAAEDGSKAARFGVHAMELLINVDAARRRSQWTGRKSFRGRKRVGMSSPPDSGG